MYASMCSFFFRASGLQDTSRALLALITASPASGRHTAGNSAGNSVTRLAKWVASRASKELRNSKKSPEIPTETEILAESSSSCGEEASRWLYQTMVAGSLGSRSHWTSLTASLAGLGAAAAADGAAYGTLFWVSAALLLLGNPKRTLKATGIASKASKEAATQELTDAVLASLPAPAAVLAGTASVGPEQAEACQLAFAVAAARLGAAVGAEGLTGEWTRLKSL